MRTPTRVYQFRISILAFVATALLAGCASSNEVAQVDDDSEVAMQCPRDLKMHCFKRTASRQDCYCVDPDELEDLLDRIGPKGVYEVQRDRDGWD